MAFQRMNCRKRLELTIFSMVTLFSSLIFIIISNKIKSIGLCLSVFDWICFNQTSNSCLDRINVRDMQPNTSRWFLWMLARVVGNSSGHFKHDLKLSMISRSRFTSSVLNLRINLVKHGKSCEKKQFYEIWRCRFLSGVWENWNFLTSLGALEWI